MSVPATKTVTAQMTLLAMLACALDGDASVERLRALPSAVAAPVALAPFAPIVAVLLGQLVAIELALAQGLDPARPRYRHKVTGRR